MGCAAKEPCTCVVKGCAKAASVMVGPTGPLRGWPMGQQGRPSALATRCYMVVVAHEATGQSIGKGAVGQCMHPKGLCMQGIMPPQLVKRLAKGSARAAQGWPLHPGAPPARVVRPESARQREGEAAAKGSQGLALATRNKSTPCCILALLGDTVAQLRSRWILHQDTLNQPTDVQTEVEVFEALALSNLRQLVFLNQVVLGPYVIAVVFAWNSLWQGQLDKLPALYADRALSTLIDGWKFWIPASIMNFGVVPLQTRVAFMSSCAIFWNFYLSTTMGKA
ncbi:hypothetical protein L7F22_024054 [Adiantum nelumboides]|nr:hypothetical protein [Adiantum nelumboides]